MDSRKRSDICRVADAIGMWILALFVVLLGALYGIYRSIKPKDESFLQFLDTL